jgi:hypothetical protein
MRVVERVKVDATSVRQMTEGRTRDRHRRGSVVRSMHGAAGEGCNESEKGSGARSSHLLAQHEQHGGIDRIPAELRSIDRQPPG